MQLTIFGSFLEVNVSRNLSTWNLMLGALSSSPYLISSAKSSIKMLLMRLLRVFCASYTIIVLLSFSLRKTSGKMFLPTWTKCFFNPLDKFWMILNPHWSKLMLLSFISLLIRVMKWFTSRGTIVFTFVLLINSSRIDFFSFHFCNSSKSSTHFAV